MIKIRKILKVAVPLSIFGINLITINPIFHENISDKCLGQIPTNIDINYGLTDCNKIPIQLQTFNITTSGAETASVALSPGSFFEDNRKL